MKARLQPGFTLIEMVTVIAVFAILTALVLANFNRGKQSEILRNAALTLVSDIRQTQNMSNVGTSIGICNEYDGNTDPASFVGSWGDCAIGAPCTKGGIVPAGHYFSCEATVPPGGFGIYLENGNATQYRIFADFSNENRFGATGIPAFYEGFLSTDSVIRTITLPDNVAIHGTQVVGQFTQNAGIVLPGVTTACINPAAPLTFTPPTEDLSFAWMQPEGKLFGIVHDQYPLTSGICPDYIFRILLQHTDTNSCRMITVNGTSGLVDEESNAACAFPPV